MSHIGIRLVAYNIPSRRRIDLIQIMDDH